MRLLHVVPSYFPAVRYGGPIRSVHGLCRALSERGHEVEVFTTNVDGPGNSAVAVDKPVEMDGVRVTYFPSSGVFRRIFRSPLMRQRLAERIGQFDFVHLHSVFLWPTWAAARTARAAGVPYILTPRGMLVPQLIARKSRVAKSVWIALIERRNLAHAAAIHATSQVEAADLRSFGWELPPVAVIPNGIEEPALRTKAPLGADLQALLDQHPNIVSLGRLSWKKGIDRLIHAVRHVRDARVLIVGDDDEGYASHLRQLASETGVSARVSILPRHVEGDEREAVFSAAGVFALPSLSENFGLAALEAMRRGAMALVTPEVGIAEIVRESGGGVVVDGGSEALGNALNALLADPAGVAMKGAAARDYVTKTCSWSKAAADFERLYSSTLRDLAVLSQG